MAENIPNRKYRSVNDPLDINELASLNTDISPEFIEQLQNKVTQSASNFRGFTEEPTDSELFEEVTKEEPVLKNLDELRTDTEKPVSTSFEEALDDNFVKKYKARLLKQQEGLAGTQNEAPQPYMEPISEQPPELSKKEINNTEVQEPSQDIENLTSGKITEKPVQQEQLDYNNSLDFLDENINYSKYVIYINPENKEFMDSLTIKERKNLINRIIREQDEIAVTKQKMAMMQTIIRHVIVALLTIAISIPVLYFTFNTCLEATINNHRNSQSMFRLLYKEHGKIKAPKAKT